MISQKSKAVPIRENLPVAAFGSDMVVIDGYSCHEAVFGLLCACFGALGSVCTWPAAPEAWCESPDPQNTLPTGSVALKSVLMEHSVASWDLPVTPNPAPSGWEEAWG